MYAPNLETKGPNLDSTEFLVLILAVTDLLCLSPLELAGGWSAGNTSTSTTSIYLLHIHMIHDLPPHCA